MELYLFYLKRPVCLRFNNIMTIIVPIMSTKTTQRLIITDVDVSTEKENHTKKTKDLCVHQSS